MSRAGRGDRTVDMERVWDYPRPPAVEQCARRVRVELGGVVLAEALRDHLAFFPGRADAA